MTSSRDGSCACGCGRETTIVKIVCRLTTHWGGNFTDLIEAAHAHDTLALKVYGSFAVLNFPPFTCGGCGVAVVNAGDSCLSCAIGDACMADLKARRAAK
jgi:hypothetical protein